MTLGETRDLLNFKWGRTGFDYNEIGIQLAVDSIDNLKTIQKKTNAEDNTDALLAEADYIFNNADLFIVDEEYAEAA